MKNWRRRAGPRAALLGAAVVLVGLLIAFLVLRGGGNSDASGSASAPAEAGQAARFTTLSAAHTNRCDLGAGEVRAMSDRMRLQGSCCFPMDQASYRSQLRGLRRYAGNDLVPRNPYDVRVGLAKRLLSYRDVALTTQQEAIYGRASKTSETGGPCCCPCWRWEAFKGQARFLIARRHYSAARIARLWGLEEGCGGNDSTQKT